MKIALTVVTLSSLLLVMASASFVVHEWGTYTSLQSSAGHLAAGMHHGEEALPDFVWSRAYDPSYWNKIHSLARGANPPVYNENTPKDCGFCEVMDWEPTANTEREVTQKLETPVIYFYSEAGIDNVEVDVEFPQGIICEIYPQAHTHSPEIGNVQATGGGQTVWTVDVAPKGVILPVPEVEADSIWVPSREVDANYVRSSVTENEEFERHIFYRGLGRFHGPVTVTSDWTHLTMENVSDEEIPAAWLMVSDGVRGFIRPLGSLEGDSRIVTGLSPESSFDLSGEESLPLEEFVTLAKNMVKDSLVAANLFEKEAQAMVDTWEYSYFKSTGSRILYIAPKSYPDQVLPLTITPTPTEIERVLVGRVEFLLPVDEEAIIEHAISAVMNETESSVKYIKGLHRFAEAKIRACIAGTPFESDARFLEKLDSFILKHLTYD